MSAKKAFLVISHKSAQNHTKSPHPAPHKACRFYQAALTPPRIDHYPTVNRLVTVPAVLLEKVMVMAGSEIYRLHAVGSENGGDGDAFVREEREIMRVMRQALDGENG